MTNEERTKLTEDIKKVVMDHLNSIGYPEITIDHVMQELPIMWQRICDAGLYREGMSFQGFVDQAYQHAMIAQILGVARMQQ